MNLDVRRATPTDVDDCVRICRELPEYFTDDVPEKLRADLLWHGGWVIAGADAGQTVGFAVVDRRSPHAVEVLWAAIAPDRRGAGLGTALLAVVFDTLAGEGVRLVEVKTLDGTTSAYPPYVATRAFWERRGFVQIDTIDPLPGWQPGNPAAIYVAALAPTT